MFPYHLVLLQANTPDNFVLTMILLLALVILAFFKVPTLAKSLGAAKREFNRGRREVEQQSAGGGAERQSPGPDGTGDRTDQPATRPVPSGQSSSSASLETDVFEAAADDSSGEETDVYEDTH